MGIEYLYLENEDGNLVKIHDEGYYKENLNCWTKYDWEVTQDVDYYQFNLEKPGKIYVKYSIEDLSTRYNNQNENTITL